VVGGSTALISGALSISSEPRRVLHVITDAGPHPYFRTLIEAGGIDRSKVLVGCVGAPGPLQEDMRSIGVRCFALGARSRAQYPLAIVRLARLLNRYRPRVVQTHLLDGSLVGLAAARLARTPLAVMTAHHSHELPFHGWRLLWPERLCTGPLCDYVIAPSRQVTRTLVELGRVPERKIEVVHHGFDLASLDPAKVSAHAVRRELGLDGELVLGAIGRLSPLKNYAELLKAFASVLDRDLDARLVIAGAGDRGPLQTLARELRIEERVFLCGPRKDVPELLAAFDIFVHPAIAESFGMVIVEAMAMARPVVTTPVGIAPEVIDPGRTGVLCASHRARALTEGLQKMLALRGRWPEVGQAAQERVAGYTAQAMAMRYQELYTCWLAQASACSAT
jgi:glycosyltransferase involved in cell wall biosynthesis